MYQKVENSSEVYLVHLLEPHASSLQIGTSEFQQDNVYPLVTDTVLDSIHYTLRDLDKRVPYINKIN